jgi:hypothetical protein
MSSPFEGYQHGFTRGLAAEVRTATCPYCGQRIVENVFRDPHLGYTALARKAAREKVDAWLQQHVTAHYSGGDVTEAEARVKALLDDLNP